MSSKTRRLFSLGSVGVCAALICLVGTMAPAWGQSSGRVIDIYQLGRPATTFSPHGANTLGELQDLFDRYESDLRTVLQQTGWPGNPDDLFRTVRSAKTVDGAVSERSVAPGETLQWMAYRRGGKPTHAKNVRWSAKQPFAAWQIEVESGGMVHTFVVPKTCLNLAYDKAEEAARATCSLSTSYDSDADLIRITGSAGTKITSVQTPSGPGDMSRLESAGANKWTYRPTADGRYTFTGEAGVRRQKATCTDSVQVSRPKAACRIDAAMDPETKVVTIDTSGSLGDVELTGVTLPDGTAGSLDAIRDLGGGRYSFDAGASLPRKTGTFTFTFAAMSHYRGTEAGCQDTASYTREPRSHKWIVRGMAEYWDPSSDEIRTDVVRPDGVRERTMLHFDSGWGLGLAVEYLFSDRWGVEGGIHFVDLDSSFMVDLDEAWEIREEDQGASLLALGLNYHLTPGRRADWFIGLFGGLVDFDDTTYNALGEAFNFDYDDGEFGYGLNAGVDVPFGADSSWVITGGLRYLLATAEEQGGTSELDVDPLILSVGIGYRF